MGDHHQQHRPTTALSREGRPAGVLGRLGSNLAGRLALGQHRARFEQAIMHLSHGVGLFDAEDRLQMFNGQFCAIFGHPFATMRIGRTFRDIVAESVALGNFPGRCAEEVWRNRKAFIDRREAGTLLSELSNGRLVAINHQPLPDGGWLATYEDVTDRRRAEAQIKFLAHHDALTQLPNRLQFSERLQQAMAAASHSRPCALLCLDLDGFKLVNDSMGHAAGDMLLRHVAQRLLQSLRTGDLAARLGGDEFAIILPDITPEEAEGVADRVNALLSAPYDLGGFGQARVGASVGLAYAPRQTNDPDTLLSYADQALYRVKRSRSPMARQSPPPLPPQRVTSDEGVQTLREAASMTDDLRAALAAGYLSLHYQAVCNCFTAEPVAYEAMLRWTDPIRGEVPPSSFIPAAEESGFIVKLSEWVLMQACTEAVRWDNQASVGVNLSPVNFSQPDLVATVANVLSETGLPPDRLVIEITEGMLLVDSAVVQRVLGGLRMLGVDLWLDDFGSGYANLALLRTMPCTSLKIDPSFLAEGPHRTAMLGGMIALGQACGLKMVAEGVETPEQHDLLRRLGCDFVQGYLFGHPVSASHLPSRDRRRSVHHGG